MESYRIYVTDSLKVIAENTAKYSGGSALVKRYADIIHPKPEDDRTSEEIIENIKTKLSRS